MKLGDAEFCINESYIILYNNHYYCFISNRYLNNNFTRGHKDEDYTL